MPSYGDVFVEGINTKDESKQSQIRQTVGMVFQNPDNQIVSSVVEEDVAFGPENLGLPREEIEKRAKEALEAVGIFELRRSSAEMLSGGQKQRVAIAGVLAMKPKCIVLDEPTSMLDPQGRKEVIETLKKLNKKDGTTIVLITHNPEELLCANRIIAMEMGKVFWQGHLDELLLNKEYCKNLGLDSSQCLNLIYKLNEKGISIPATLNESECINNLVKVLGGI